MTDPAPGVLIIGGAGVFGSRLVVGLLASTTWTVIIAGRNAARLMAMAKRCDAMPGTAGRVRIMVLDARRVTADQLRTSGAFAVVDAAGPYQGGDYHLAEAAIDAGLHYVDLADARDFIAGFATLDGAAKRAGVVAITGASTTPALSTAVLDSLTAQWTAVDRVEIAMSPGNQAPRGLSVMRSILSYAGRRVRVFTDKRWCLLPGWGMTVRRELPGLGRRWLSLADTPDLDIVPARFSPTTSTLFRAGLELPLLHFGLLVISLPVRLGLVRSLVPLAKPFRWLAGLMQPFGTDQGGMSVGATGSDPLGHPVQATWSMVAQAGDGPFVPTLPTLAVLRRLADRRIVQPGASVCVGVLSLEDIEAEFRPHQIRTARSLIRLPGSLYEQVLQDAFAPLPEPLRRLHSPAGKCCASGLARIDGADGWIARRVAGVFGFPPTGENIPVTVEITASAGQETWHRDFGGRRFVSVLTASPIPGCLVERFGPFVFTLDLRVGPRGVLGMPVRAWRLGPIPLPGFLAPKSLATETVDPDGRFQFDVEMRLPLGLGRVVRYRGWLVPDAGSAAA